MRIALVTESFYPAVDGTTTTVKAVADRLVDTGHEVQPRRARPGPADATAAQPGRAVPAPGPARAARSARRSPTSRPDLVHVTSPGPLGRKALKHARRLGIATVVVEQSAGARPDRRLLAGQGAPTGPTRLRGHLAVDGRAGAASSASGRPVDARASTPPRSPRSCATRGCTAAGRAPAHAAGPSSSSATSAACAASTAYAASPSSPRCPGSGRWSSATGRSAAGCESRLPGRRVHRGAGARRPQPSPSPPSTCWCTRASTRPAATRCARRRRAAYPSWRPASGGAPRRRTPPGDRPALRPGRPARAAAGRRGASPATRRRALLGAARAASWPRRATGAPRSTSWWPGTTRALVGGRVTRGRLSGTDR